MAKINKANQSMASGSAANNENEGVIEERK
jgi:hypothetical protein